ncbi:PAS domain-containing sensor histidine kinase [Ancylomarina sp. DW003]|nr:PAS domain-containing sensor histidine kinase [Ancylomarina sp. DW003]MDE5422529.1 PAS domain-containing sensor histidine kinase [Ancylomarina sp. DW003]
MVEKCLQAEILLELMLDVKFEENEDEILKKSLPLYLRKLNCFLASVLKNDNNKLEQMTILPFAAGKSDDWIRVRAYFVALGIEERERCPHLVSDNFYYYGFCLNGYGLLVLGRKKAFDEFFLKELQAVVYHLGKVLIQSKEKKRRERAEQKLRISESRLSLLMQESPYILEVYDVNGFQISVNKAYEEFWQVSSSETLRKFNVLQSEVVRNTDMINYISRAYEGETVSVPVYKFKKQSKHKRDDINDYRWLSTRIYPLKNKDNEVEYITVVHDDVTDRILTEKKLIIAKEKAEESDRLKSAFLTNMSHEIRTPMNGILGFADLLKQSSFDKIDQHDFIDLIEKSSVRMLEIIDNLINISKIESGQMELDISTSNINKLIELTYSEHSNKAIEKGLKILIVSVLPEKESMVRTDCNKLVAVLSKLINNAIKYTNKGHIEVNVIRKDSFYEFCVKDTGIGISEDKQQAVFHRFIQADIGDRRSFEGAGLGLSISKAYVEMLGGKIWMKSKLNKGSAFYFSIPTQLFNQKETTEEIEKAIQD